MEVVDAAFHGFSFSVNAWFGPKRTVLYLLQKDYGPFQESFWYKALDVDVKQKTVIDAELPYKSLLLVYFLF